MIDKQTKAFIKAAERQIGKSSTRALREGGEELLDRVEAAHGVALRHLDRLRKGELPLTDQVRIEINRSLERAGADVFEQWAIERGKKEAGV